MPGNLPPVTDERDGLLRYIAQQRAGIHNLAYGLSEQQIRATPTKSAICIGGLIKHVTAMERSWLGIMLNRQRIAHDEQAEPYGADWVVTEEDILDGLLADYEACARETEEALAAIQDLGQPVPVPRDVPWFPQDVEAWSVRWVLLHVLEEIARHAGQGDIIREHIDGATMYELMAGAEGWPETPWLRPWHPPTPAEA